MARGGFCPGLDLLAVSQRKGGRDDCGAFVQRGFVVFYLGHLLLFAIVDTLFAGETPKSGMLESDSELRSLDSRCVLVRISDFPARVHVVL